MPGTFLGRVVVGSEGPCHCLGFLEALLAFCLWLKFDRCFRRVDVIALLDGGGLGFVVYSVVIEVFRILALVHIKGPLECFGIYDGLMKRIGFDHLGEI